MYYFKRIIDYSLFAAILILALMFFNSLLYASSFSSKLEQKVQNAISRNFNNNFEITATNDGIVTIRGQVNRLYDKYRIFDIAEKVKGIKDVKVLLAVNTQPLPDNIIKQNLLEDLRLNNSILEPNRIKVFVDNGLIELKGIVSYPYEKKMVETIASWQRGAKGIVNEIKVLPLKIAESNHNIKLILRDIIKDRFPLENKVEFTVHNGIVKIYGDARDGWAKDNLQITFNHVKGVKEVINEIKVAPNRYSKTA
jgi:osmotically-inducible protein OsmY